MRKKRLNQRGMDYNDKKEKRIGVNENFLNLYKDYEVIEIDNSQSNPINAVEKIIKLIE